MLRALNLLVQYAKVIGIRGVFTLIRAKMTNKKITFDYLNPTLNEKITLRFPSSDTWVYKQVFIDEEYKFKAISEPKVIIDAGANVGFASIYFSHLFPNAKIIALEPEINNYSLLLENVKNYSNIIPLQAALWSENTKINLCDAGLGEWGFMTFKNSNENVIVEHQVDAYTVDELIKKFSLGKIDILKIDIEGAEKEVFENTEKWINNVEALIVELHDRMKEGCSRSFYNNTSGFDYEWVRGENIYLSKGNILK